MFVPLRFIATALALICWTARAADWPRWRGPDNNGHVPKDALLPARLPAELPPLWRVKIGEGAASPVVARGKVFHLDKQSQKETVNAVEAATGKKLWSVPLDDSFEDTQSIGPRCTPTVEGERVYVQSRQGEFQCLDAADGRVVWRKHFVKDFGAVFIGEKGEAQGAARHGFNGAPLIDGDHILALAGGTNGASVLCLEKTTGALVWKSQNDPAAYAPPVMATIGGVRQIICFTADGLMAVTPDTGKPVWRVPLKTKFARHVTTPVVAGNMVIVASQELGLVGVQIAPAGQGQKATQAWVNKEAAINFSSPVLAGDHLYGVGPARNLICVDPQSGKIQWSKDGYFTSAASKVHAGILVFDKNLLVLTDGGELLLLAADPTACRQINRVQVCGFNWCNPAYADGKLYLRDARELVCVNLLP